jgi:hypothetical protein
MDPAIVEFALWNAAVRSPQDRLILLAVGRWRRVWREVTPSVKYIASEVGVSERHCRTVLNRLAADGLIIITRRRAGGSQATNKYDINPEGCIACVPAQRLATLRRLVQSTDCTPCTQQTAQPAPKTRTRENNKQEQSLKPPTEPQGSTDSDAELHRRIYAAYPRHVGRGRAMDAIEKAIVRIAVERGTKCTVAATWLLAKVRDYAASPAGQRGEYTPHPSTWMNQERYTDDPNEWKRGEADRRNRRTDSEWAGKDDHLTSITVE